MIFHIIFFLFSFLPSLARYKPYTIMIDPAGDARQPGRLIHDSLERGITFQYAQSVKKLLEKISSCSVILSREPGEIIYQFQNANYANRMQIDLYITVHACSSSGIKSILDLYYYGSQELVPTQPNQLSMTPLNKAYQKNFHQTQSIAHQIKETITNYYPHICLRGIHMFPIKTLKGLCVPSFQVELSLAKNDDWQQFVEPVAVAIAHQVNS